jgi:hypothetical protein
MLPSVLYLRNLPIDEDAIEFTNPMSHQNVGVPPTRQFLIGRVRHDLNNTDEACQAAYQLKNVLPGTDNSHADTMSSPYRNFVCLPHTSHPMGRP